MAHAAQKRQPGELARFKRADRDLAKWRRRLECELRRAAPFWTSDDARADYYWGVLLRYLLEARGSRLSMPANATFARVVDETMARELDEAWRGFGIRVRFNEDRAGRRVIFTVR